MAVGDRPGGHPGVRPPAGRPRPGRRRLDDPAGATAIHRLGRLADAEAEGRADAEAPIPCDDDPDAESLIVEIGGRGLTIACVRAEAFDRLFGAPAETKGEPAVYEGWRLP